MSDMAPGIVEGIYMKSSIGGPIVEVDEVKAIEGFGLEGDPYPPTDNPTPGEEVTLISREAIEEFIAEGNEFAPGESRRQLETRGIDLNSLIGKRFRVGEVELVGVKQCRPCKVLQKMTGKPVLRGLHNKGGLRADIVSPGIIRRGDEVVPLD